MEDESTSPEDGRESLDLRAPEGGGGCVVVCVSFSVFFYLSVTGRACTASASLLPSDSGKVRDVPVSHLYQELCSQGLPTPHRLVPLRFS